MWSFAVQEKYVYLLDQVKHCHAAANRRQKANSIWSENEITLTVHGTEQAGKLFRISKSLTY